MTDDGAASLVSPRAIGAAAPSPAAVPIDPGSCPMAMIWEDGGISLVHPGGCVFDHEQVARVCCSAIRQLREEQGDDRGPVWSLLSRTEQRWYIDAVQRARAGLLPAQIHEAWRQELLAAGWRRGDKIDHFRKTHPELEQWGALPEKYRIRFILLHYMAVPLTIDVPRVWGGSWPVTAP